MHHNEPATRYAALLCSPCDARGTIDGAVWERVSQQLDSRLRESRCFERVLAPLVKSGVGICSVLQIVVLLEELIHVWDLRGASVTLKHDITTLLSHIIS